MFAKIFSVWAMHSPLGVFFILTFGLAWAIWLPVIFFAPQYLLFAIIPGAWAPTLAALLVIGATQGRAGVRAFLKRLWHWRVGWRWYGVVLFSIAILAYIALGLYVVFFDGHLNPLNLPPNTPPEAWPVAIVIVFIVNIFVGGPLAEDIGWRGYALPKLRERMNTVSASLVIGVIWVVWHSPFFWIAEGGVAVGQVPFVWFALLTTAWSVLFAWVYVNTHSILMPVLFHAAVNTTLGTLGVLGSPSEDLTPIVLNTLVTWAAVLAIIGCYGLQLQRKSLPRP